MNLHNVAIKIVVVNSVTNSTYTGFAVNGTKNPDAYSTLVTRGFLVGPDNISTGSTYSTPVCLNTNLGFTRSCGIGKAIVKLF